MTVREVSHRYVYPLRVGSEPTRRAISKFADSPSVLGLNCGIQHYSWGDENFIPDLLGINNLAGKPFAEMWIGAHPKLTSTAYFGRNQIGLDDLIKAAPVQMLGPIVARKYDNNLPFLLKVLSAERPLSIQAHPNKVRASLRFGEKHPSYSDENHKPEIICALTEFWAFNGFKPLGEITASFSKLGINATGPLKEAFRAFNDDRGAARDPEDRLKALYSRIMKLSKARLSVVTQRAVNFARRIESPGSEENWALALNEGYPGDAGVLGVHLFNLVRLAPGEAMYIPAGEPHAYLQGSGIELAANSDNVLRGGLTAKRKDVDELIDILNYSTGKPKAIAPGFSAMWKGAYETPAKEFELSVIELDKSKRPFGPGPDLFIVTKGEVNVSCGNEVSRFVKGGAFMVPFILGNYELSSSGKAGKVIQSKRASTTVLLSV